MIDVLAGRLRAILGDQRVISDRQRLRTYECDGLAHYKVVPALVVLPHTAEECAAVVRACVDGGVPFVARGSGTGLSGGALPHADGVLIVTSQMRAILEVDPADERAVVEPGRDQPARHQGRDARTATTTRRTRPASRSARSAATWRRTPAARTASSTASPPTTSLGAAGGHPGRRPGPARRPGTGRARLRPARRVRRLRGHARHRHRGHRAADPAARVGAHPARGVRRHRRRGRGDLGDHRRRRRAGRGRDDGRAGHRGGRGGGGTAVTRPAPAPC